MGVDVTSIDRSGNIAFILGNEARGMCEEANNYVDGNLFIKMSNTESLNVSIAGSILMYEIAKK
jgi:TrmH family RNA methyltransferase